MTSPLLVLGSGSPRRRELLAALVPSFDVRPPHVVETISDGAIAAARTLATTKAVATRAEDGEVVLAADTLVARGTTIYGKPAGPIDAHRMLWELAGGDHLVVTGVAVAQGGNVLAVDHSIARVTLRDLGAPEIEAYVASGRPLDKAGAYAIQDEDVRLVERLSGCYCNVMGLPLWRTAALLEGCGISSADPSHAYARCADCPERDGVPGPTIEP